MIRTNTKAVVAVTGACIAARTSARASRSPSGPTWQCLDEVNAKTKRSINSLDSKLREKVAILHGWSRHVGWAL